MKTTSSILLVTFLSIGLGVAAEARPPLPVGVLLFDSAYKVKRRNVTDLISANLTEDPRLVLVERAELTRVLEEQAMGRGGLISPDSAARIGQLTGAKVLVTGRLFKAGTDYVITARVIGAETGRVYTKTAQGPAEKLVEVTATLSKEIVQTINDQATNLVASVEVLREQRVSKLLKAIKGTKRPAVQMKITETIPDEDKSSHTVQNELGVLLQKAGFHVVEGASERQPDIVITGEAVAGGGLKRGNLFSSRATVEVRAQHRISGRLLAIERQESASVDVNHQVAVRLALERAADDLASRLLPLLAQ